MITFSTSDVFPGREGFAFCPLRPTLTRPTKGLSTELPCPRRQNLRIGSTGRSLWVRETVRSPIWRLDQPSSHSPGPGVGPRTTPGPRLNSVTRFQRLGRNWRLADGAGDRCQSPRHGRGAAQFAERRSASYEEWRRMPGVGPGHSPVSRSTRASVPVAKTEP